MSKKINQVFRPISAKYKKESKTKGNLNIPGQKTQKEKKVVQRRGGFGDLNGVGGIFLAHQITNMNVHDDTSNSGES